MPLYEFQDDKLVKIERTTFAAQGVKERTDLQRVLRDNIGVVVPDCMVIDEEFGAWEEGHRRIDLLCLDADANLVVVELKRDERGAHMELQALRYAAMVSTMTFEQAVEAHADYLARRHEGGDARQAVLDFLGWGGEDDGEFAPDVRVVLVSGDFGKELTTAVLWLQGREIDIRCVRLQPYEIQGRIVLDVEQVLPLPEAEDYIVSVRRKESTERLAREGGRDYTKLDVTVDGQVHHRLPKRTAVLMVVRALCAGGVSPEAVAAAIPWRAIHRLWFTLEGVLDADEFVKVATGPGSPGFDSRRWFCGDQHLVHFGDKTYAFTTQWGGRSKEAIDCLLSQFPKRGIECAESAQ